MIRSEIEIAASPEVVRGAVGTVLYTASYCTASYCHWHTIEFPKFVDFPKLSEWHKGQIVSIERETTQKSTGQDMKPGNRILSKIEGMQFYQIVGVYP